MQPVRRLKQLQELLVPMTSSWNFLRLRKFRRDESGLSGGQRQRIAIARAVLQRPNC